MKKTVVIFLVLLAPAIKAQRFNKQKLDSLFTLLEVSNKGMGSVSIFHDGAEVYQRSYGYSDVEDKFKADDETKYRIGSIAKMFTATIIMQLVEEEKLTLDTRLSKFYPKIPNADKITIEHMLRHQSGIFNFTNSADYTSWMEQPISKKDLVKKITSFKSVFEPGEKTEYSNSNYVLLSFIIEKKEHKPYSMVVKKRFLVSYYELGMNDYLLENTYYGGKTDPVFNEAYSYNRTTRWERATETDMSVLIGAGAIISTPTDLNMFLNLLFGGSLVSEASLMEMENVEDGFGIGMFKIPFYERSAFGHTGGIDGFRASALYFPEENVSVAITSNGVVMPLNDILIGVLSIYFNRDYELPEFTEAIQLKPAELDKYLGVYSSPTFPLKITITKEGNILKAQATGQPSFPLEAFAKDKFKYDQAKLEMDFTPDEGKVIFKQAGMTFELVKE